MSVNWKRLFGFSQDDVLGLDIGSSSVRMIQLAKTGDGYTVVAAHVCDIKQDNTDAALKAYQDSLTIRQTLTPR